MIGQRYSLIGQRYSLWSKVLVDWSKALQAHADPKGRPHQIEVWPRSQPASQQANEQLCGIIGILPSTVCEARRGGMPTHRRRTASSPFGLFCLVDVDLRSRCQDLRVLGGDARDGFGFVSHPERANGAEQRSPRFCNGRLSTVYSNSFPYRSWPAHEYSSRLTSRCEYQTCLIFSDRVIVFFCQEGICSSIL